MPIHPQVRAVLERRGNSGMPESASMDDMRRLFFDTWREAGPEVFKVEDRRIPGPAGEIPVRIYTPSEDGPFPVLLEFHGGGWVFGGIESYDGNCRRLCRGADCVVVNVGYRLAPENKFPAAVDDAYAATKWVADNAASINVDPTRIAVGGDSAGANMSTVVALMARERGGPPLALQILVCPAVQRDFTPLTYDREETPPMPVPWFWQQYLNDEADASNPYACPMHADLRGLPPALVITAEYDPVSDEGAAFAEKLKQAGVPTTFKHYEGMIHIFHQYPGFIDGAREAVEQEVDALKAAFAGQPVPGAR